MVIHKVQSPTICRGTLLRAAAILGNAFLAALIVGMVRQDSGGTILLQCLAAVGLIALMLLIVGWITFRHVQEGMVCWVRLENGAAQADEAPKSSQETLPETEPTPPPLPLSEPDEEESPHWTEQPYPDPDVELAEPVAEAAAEEPPVDPHWTEAAYPDPK